MTTVVVAFLDKKDFPRQHDAEAILRKNEGSCVTLTTMTNTVFVSARFDTALAADAAFEAIQRKLSGIRAIVQVIGGPTHKILRNAVTGVI